MIKQELNLKLGRLDRKINNNENELRKHTHTQVRNSPRIKNLLKLPKILIIYNLKLQIELLIKNLLLISFH